MRQPEIEIPVERVRRRMQAENPWWESSRADDLPFASLTHRPYLDLLFPLVRGSEIRRAVVLLGPRRVGKTVLIHHAVRRLIREGVPARKIFYLSVDHPLYNQLDLEQFLEHYRRLSGIDPDRDEVFVFFDEIQYLRSWEQHLKRFVDDHPRLRCVVSGSAAAALRVKGRESGAGRFTEFFLPPLTFFEYVALVGRAVDFKRPFAGSRDARAARLARINETFIDYLRFGGYPELALSESLRRDPHRFVKSDIIDKVLLRDLPSLYGIQDIQELNSLFTTLAYNTAGEVSLEKLSNYCGVSKTTLKRYLDYLEAAFLIRIVHRVDRAAKRFTRANRFKVYLTNPSMHSALFSSEVEGAALERLVETAVFAQIFHSDVPVHYGRWDDDEEVDLVFLSADQRVTGVVKVKWSDRTVEHVDELGTAVRFAVQHGLSRILVTTKARFGGRETPSGVECTFFPTALYAYDVGRRILARQRERLFAPDAAIAASAVAPDASDDSGLDGIEASEK